MAVSAVMATTVAPSVALLGSRTGSAHQLRAFGLPSLSVRRQSQHMNGKLFVRAVQQKDNAPLPDTKRTVTQEGVNKNQEDETLRVFDNSPAGKFSRPESERRPELGNTDIASVMKFDGPAPETINGRLAMLGMTWAFAVEVFSGKGVAEQTVQGTGLLWFLAVVPILIWATLAPIFGWNESPDSRSFGPFNAKAERWNGRAAMIGFASLLITENFILHGPLFGIFHR